MKAKLSKGGFLSFYRAGKWRLQYCPYSHTGEDKEEPCGDWCPQLDEGETEEGTKFLLVSNTYCGEVVDERRQNDNDPKNVLAILHGG